MQLPINLMINRASKSVPEPLSEHPPECTVSGIAHRHIDKFPSYKTGMKGRMNPDTGTRIPAEPTNPPGLSQKAPEWVHLVPRTCASGRNPPLKQILPWQ